MLLKSVLNYCRRTGKKKGHTKALNKHYAIVEQKGKSIHALIISTKFL